LNFLSKLLGLKKPDSSASRLQIPISKNFKESQTPQYVYYQPLKACIEGALTTFVIGDAS
jgi:hypothetical protein